MAAKPESVFISSVHKHLPKVLHKEKTNNPYRGGIADCWYSGAKGDLWVEYKYLPSVPKIGDITWQRLGISSLQYDWLSERSEEGRNVAVVVGTPEGGVIYKHREWAITHSCVEFKQKLILRPHIANFIVGETMKA